MTLDLARVRARLAELRERVPDQPAWWQTGPVWSTEQLGAFEATHGALPADLRAWLLAIGDGGAGFLAPEDGFVALARFPPDAHVLAKPFRTAQPARTVMYPIGGALYLGELRGDQAFLVVRGERAGEVWIDRTKRKDGAFVAAGTFAELTAQWLAREPEVQPPAAAAVPLDADAAFGRWKRMCGDLIGSLRAGPHAMVEVFEQIAAGKQREAITHLASRIHLQLDRWLFDPRLAPVAALVLTACVDRINTPRTRVEHALAAIADHSEAIDLAPDKVAEMLAAVRASSTYEDAHLFWFERELRAAGRLDEAIAVFRARAIWQQAEYVEMARALIAAGRADEAVVLGEELGARTRIKDLDWARGWILVEVGQAERGAKLLAQVVAFDSDKRRQQAVAALHRDPAAARSPDDIAFVASAATRPFPMHAVTVHYEITALLYAIGDEGADAIDAAVRALSYAGVRRFAQEHANHLASLRIAQAIAGQAPAPEPRLRADYQTTAAHGLAKRLLARLAPLGVELVYRHRYR